MPTANPSNRKFEQRVWWSSNRGVTLIELLVTLVILSILASVALPYAEIVVRREKEAELRESLRGVRTAIDRFHDDWRNGAISKTGTGVSDDGFPKTLTVLVDGTESGDAKGAKRKYLRRIPADPFGDQAKEPAKQWLLRGYQDDAGARSWNGRDVFDVGSQSQAQALDGSNYKTW
jgi:general secretion pathway protein G